jgi:hypothetical protein
MEAPIHTHHVERKSSVVGFVESFYVRVVQILKMRSQKKSEFFSWREFELLILARMEERQSQPEVQASGTGMNNNKG